jgi:type III secretion protein Q
MNDSSVGAVAQRPPVHSLRGRIAAVDPAPAASLRQLFGRSRQLPRKGDISLSLLGRAPAALPLAEIGDGDAGFWVGLLDDALAQPVDGRNWRDFEPGEARNAAWLLAYEPLLDALSGLLQLDPLPRGLHDSEPASLPPDLVWLGFEAVHAQPDRVTRGRLGLAPSRLLAFAEAVQRLPQLPLDIRPWLSLKLRLRLATAPIELPLATLRSLRGGDVLIAGHRLAVLDGLVAAIDDGPRFAVSTESGRYRIDRALPALEHTRSPGPEAKEAAPMNDDVDNSVAKPNEQPPASEGPALDALPVRLEFDLGQLSIALGELAALAPGYVFTLPQPVEGSNVTIRANGTAVGRGELVAVGETLGVRLLALGTNGLQ